MSIGVAVESTTRISTIHLDTDTMYACVGENQMYPPTIVLSKLGNRLQAHLPLFPRSGFCVGYQPKLYCRRGNKDPSYCLLFVRNEVENI